MSDGVDKVIRQINTALFRVQNKTVFAAIAKMAGELIKKRTRVGYGVNEKGANKKKFRGLQDSTIDQRKKKRKRGILDNRTTPSKSNLTDTGQLLDAIGSRATNTYGEVYIAQQRKDGVLNSDIVEGQELMDRIFFNLSSAEIKQLQRELRNILRSKIVSKK